MAVSRRGFIRVIGGGVVGTALVGGGLQGCDRMPASAVAPWNGAPAGETDPRQRALSWALLAPNPHNMQPWLVDLRREGEILLHVDRTRLLPETDPFARQIVIGHGTFLELLVLAAGADGYRCEIDYFPQGQPAEGEVDDRPLARIRLQRDSVTNDPLFAQIPHRRSTKEPYLAQALQPDHARDLQVAHRAGPAQLTITSDAALAAGLRGITERAMLIELQTPRALKESIDRLRVGADAIAAQPDGIELHGPFFWWLSKLGLMTPEKAMTPGTMAWQGGIDYALGWARATPAFGWLTTVANDRVSQIEAGRAYVRLNLKATELGVVMHPVSQVLQEYPEMAALQRDFAAMIGVAAGQTVQMLFRLGYSDPVPPSPRRPLDALLMS
ncbi:twin-arginine translocation pathway signal protein [Ferrovibrio terrae]|uniref:Twin-arginine translocation pathway signal protein n=1 Tax=Ferrovibrio terrae TaxID=2594003 RepID=A0A516GWM7_9PROT|nr:twin-arginine translocation pathway signal protein [Ferrovibrio terrae]QDO95943.1 twin-arginine translocation pathway signal protein [Ferrovibrio terrae]